MCEDKQRSDMLVEAPCLWENKITSPRTYFALEKEKEGIGLKGCMCLLIVHFFMRLRVISYLFDFSVNVMQYKTQHLRNIH